MTNSEQVVENGTASSLIGELGKALHELQACKDACEDQVQWSEIEEHFFSLEAKLKNKFEEIEVREKEYEEKEAQTYALLAEREEAVYAKEQELLDRIQLLKDAAVAVIAEAQANYLPTSLDSIDGGDIKDNKLGESFPIVPLLKTFLKDKMRSLQGSGDLSTAAGVQSDANAQELAALRAVIRCIEECKLQAEYPLDPLQRRVAELKSKVDKNKVGDFGKHQKQKKQRANGGYRGFRGGAGGGRQPTLFAERTVHPGMPDRYPHAVPNLYDYQVPSQSAFGQQATDQRMYYHPQDDIVTASSYGANPSNYSSYMGPGMRPSQQPYM